MNIILVFFYLEGITAPYIPTVEVGMKLALIGNNIRFHFDLHILLARLQI